ncbi:proheparin-binding EGF-like growth factor isoform X1 [Zootoca vivipara]|uniref:proheparin-binding EGF-like growth factor isoform X1 n=1 Tax=Zootoca vivipara TaxID=8524 RepID=UPI00293C1004|nr:proheparin-binding EGF-like growth factor isoform X1 [Zootoca vivipara]
MRAALILWSVLLAAGWPILAKAEELRGLRNEVYHEEGREDLASVQLLPAREALEHEGERGGSVSTAGDNFSELPRAGQKQPPEIYIWFLSSGLLSKLLATMKPTLLQNLRPVWKVAFLSNPQEPVSPVKEGKGEKRRKGKGRKRDPCLRRYKDYCIHGECKYIKALKSAHCICEEGYHGARCHALSLPVENPSRGYNHTTILAVTAVVLSSLCLIIIAVLLMLRCHKQGVYDVESEEKVKLGITVNH